MKSCVSPVDDPKLMSLITTLEQCEAKHGFRCEHCAKWLQCRKLYDKLSERALDKLITEPVYQEFKAKILLMVNQLTMFN